MSGVDGMEPSDSASIISDKDAIESGDKRPSSNMSTRVEDTVEEADTELSVVTVAEELADTELTLLAVGDKGDGTAKCCPRKWSRPI